MNWTQPMCERCWFDQRGNVMPTRVNALPPAERCAWCGRPTVAGIYVRQDPTAVPYPAEYVEH